MAEVWALEVVKGLGGFFLNPVLYFAIGLALYAGYLRVKRERKDFHTRVNGVLHELGLLLPAGLAAGAILTVLFIVTGLVLPLPMIAAIAAATVLLGAAGNGRLLSPAFTVGLPAIFLMASSFFGWHLPYFGTGKFTHEEWVAIGAFIGILLIAEGFLILKNGLRDVSPKLRTSSRGLTVGAHQTKRLWLLPIFCLLPAGNLSSPAEWWPVLQAGGDGFTPLFLPFLLGFQQQTQSVLPQEAVGRVGRQVLLLGFLVLGVGIAGYWVGTYAFIAAPVLAAAGRIWISHRHRVRERSTPYYFTPRNKGVMILDVIPGTPAEKMGLKRGEIIQTCNGQAIRTKQELYEALLKNRAYCKLDVLDSNGEIRMLQRALYEGDHHELGILFVEKRNSSQTNRAV